MLHNVRKLQKKTYLIVWINFAVLVFAVTYHLYPFTCHLSPVTYPALRILDMLGTCVLATFEIRQPNLAEPKAQPDIFSKELA